MDILDCLQADYDAMRTLLIEFQVGPVERSRESTFTELISRARSYGKAEESAVLLEAKSVDELRPLSSRMLSRYDAIERLADEIGRLRAGSEAWNVKTRLYCELLELQINDGQRELLSGLFDQYLETARREMGRGYARCFAVSRRSCPSRDGANDIVGSRPEFRHTLVNLIVENRRTS